MFSFTVGNKLIWESTLSGILVLLTCILHILSSFPGFKGCVTIKWSHFLASQRPISTRLSSYSHTQLLWKCFLKHKQLIYIHLNVSTQTRQHKNDPNDTRVTDFKIRATERAHIESAALKMVSGGKKYYKDWCIPSSISVSLLTRERPVWTICRKQQHKRSFQSMSCRHL